MTAAVTRTAGRPRNPGLDCAILAAAEQQLREFGYARMSLDSVAAAAGTTVPSVRRRFRGKADLAASVIGSLRIADLPAAAGAPRARALAVLRNFHDNLRRPDSLAIVGTLLAEERAVPNCSAPSAAASSGRAGRCSAMRWPTPSRPASSAVRRPGGTRQHAHRLLLRPLPGCLRHPG